MLDIIRNTNSSTNSSTNNKSDMGINANDDDPELVKQADAIDYRSNPQKITDYRSNTQKITDHLTDNKGKYITGAAIAAGLGGLALARRLRNKKKATVKK
jgi:hypothetical protein